MTAATTRQNGMLLTSKMRQSLRVLSWVSSAARTVRHFSGVSGGMRISIIVTAGQIGLSLGGATFMALGISASLDGRGVPDHAAASLFGAGKPPYFHGRSI
jgi:hypothetical protein